MRKSQLWLPLVLLVGVLVGCSVAQVLDNQDGTISCGNSKDQCKEYLIRTVENANFNLDCSNSNACEGAKLVVRQGSTLNGDIDCRDDFGTKKYYRDINN